MKSYILRSALPMMVIATLLSLAVIQILPASNAVAAVNSWSALSNSPATIQAVAVDQTTTHPNETIYVGTTTGVSKSTDGGATWTAIDSGLTTLDVLSLAIDPVTHTTIYAGTNGGGVFKSTNGGSSWAVHTNSATIIYCIAIDPTNSSIIYLGTSTSLWKTTNASTYVNTKVGGGNPGKLIYSIEFDPTNSLNLYLGTSAGLYRDLNGTLTTEAVAPLTTSDAVKGIAAAAPSTAYIVSTNTSNVGKGFTNTAALSGTTWTQALGLTTSINHALNLYQGVLYAATNNGIWKSTDSGANYSNDALSGATVTAFDTTTTTPPTIFAATSGIGLHVMTLSPTVGVSPAALAYGNGDVGTAYPLTLTISNTGKGNLVVSSIALSGTDAARFSVTTGGATPCASLTPTIGESASCTVLVTFTPNSPGAKSATLTVNSNDVSTPAQTAPLSGTGNPLPVIGLSPSLKAFGTVNTGSQVQQLFTISNSGGANLNVGATQITGINASEFSLTTGGATPCTATTNFSVAPSASCGLLVTFAPATAGNKSAALSIPSNDASSPTQAALTGTGNPVPVVGISPASKDFGSVNINASATQVFTISNSGAANLVVSGTSISGANAAMFTVLPGGGTPCANLTPTIVPGGYCTVTVTFTPASAGAKSAALNVSSNDPVTSPKSAALTGTGNPIAIVTVSPATKDFGSVNIGFTSAQFFTISNSGQANLVVSGITLGGLNPTQYSVAPGGGSPCGSLTPTIAAAGSCTVSVTFAPTSSGALTATLDVASNDLVNPLMSASMIGTGTTIPIVGLSPNGKDFGSVNVNATATQSFTISNSGLASLAVTSIAISGANANKFTVVPGGANACANLTPTIAPGGNCTVTVTFAPTSVGAHSAALNVDSNDPNTATKSVSLTGTGNPLPQITLTPAPAGFGNSNVGVGKPMDFTISNTGLASLTVTGISTSGTNATMFTVSTGGATPCTTLAPTIAAGAFCTIRVTFTPTATGSKTANLDVVSNDPASPLKSAAMTGTGIGVAALTVTPAAIVFGNEEIGASQQIDLTISNTGTADLSVSSMAIGGADTGMFAVSLGGTNPCPSLNPTLTPGASCTLTGTFIPLTVSNKSATLTIASNSPSSPQIVNLSGNGLSNVPTAFVIVNGGLNPISNINTVSFNASGSDIAAYKWKIDTTAWSAEVPITKISTKVGLTHGPHTLYVVGKSISGYWPDYATAITATWFVDLIKPVTTAAPLGGTYPSDRSVTLTATDDGAPGAAAPRIYYTINGATPTAVPGNLYSASITVPLSPVSPKVTLKYFAVDAAGNAEPVKSQVYAFEPVATITGVPVNPTNSPAISFKIGGPGVVAYKYSIDTADVPVTAIETLVAAPLAKTGLAIGDHTVLVIGKNALGTWQALPTTATWTIEKAAPATVANPDAGSYDSSQSVLLTSEAGARIYYTLNGTLPTTASPYLTGSGTVLVPVSSASPMTTLKYFARDVAGNSEAVKSAAYALNPTATLAGAPAGSTNLATASLTVGGAGVIAYKYTLDNPDLSAAAVTPAATKITLSALTDGSHTVRVIAKNALGAWQSTPTMTAWTVDITPPGALAATPAGGPFSDVQDVSLASDDGGAKIYYTLNGTVPTAASTLFNGTPIRISYTTTLKFIAIDSMGNVSAVKSETYTLQAHAQITGGLPTGPTNSTSYTLTVGGTGVTAYKFNLNSADMSGATETPVATKISLTNVPPGPQTLYVIGKNAANVWQTTPTAVSWLIDVTPPTTTAPAGGTFATAQTVVLLCSDSKATVYYTVDGSAPTTASPKYTGPLTFNTTTTLKFFSRDAVGNNENVQTVTYEILPGATITPAPAALIKTNSLSLKVGGNFVTSYKYRLDNSDLSTAVETPVATSISLTATDLTEGSHTLYLIGKNGKGTWQTSATAVTWAVDMTAPVSSASFDSGTNLVTLSTVDAHAATIYYTINSTPPTVTSPVYSAPFPVPVNATVRYFAKDAVGNIETVKTSIYRPTAVLTGAPPTNTKLTSATIGVAGSGVTAYNYQLEKDGSVIVPWTTETPISVKIAKTLLTSGSYTLSVVAKLTAGTNSIWQDQAAPTVVTWRIDTIKPTQTVISPLPGLYYLPQTITLTSPSGDPIYYTTNGTVPTVKSAKYTDAGISISTTTTLQFLSIDAAGNLEPVHKVVYQIPPTTTVTGVSGTSSPDVTFGVTGANVASFKYKVDSGQWSSEFKVSSKVSLFGIPSGDHVLSTIGKDAGGSWQVVPTKTAWTVQ